MKILAPAKINLYLHISGKRPDGFHELESLMCPVDLMDEIEIMPTESGITLSVEGAELSAGPDNLVWRAADLVLRASGKKQGVKILLKKKIPMGGGLGGGSSDAAAVLLAVNELTGETQSLENLSRFAAELGSDVAFFLFHQPAICRGRGEIVEPVEAKGLPWVVLINPGFGVPTPWAYKTYAAHPASGENGRAFPWTPGGITIRNDLEPAVFSKYLWIAEAKAWLQKSAHCLDSLMSGSGATVFALVEDGDTAARLTEAIRGHFGHHVWTHAGRLLERAPFKTT